MDNMIVIDLSLFSKESSIIICKDGDNTIKKCPLDSIPEMVLELSKTFGINEVKINGITTYAKEIAREIELKEKIEYSENKINIEVL